MSGKKIAMGEKGGETHSMAKRLLAASGVDDKNAQLFEWDAPKTAEELKQGNVDFAFFVTSANNPFIQTLLKDPNIRLVSLDQADAITRQFRYLHHLVLPHGTLDLKANIPAKDIDLVAPTATLMVRNSIHPALVYLLMKAASKVHHEPGIFAEKKEFPIDKDFVFPLNAGAKEYYKNGAPFWLRYLPFWLAILAERFIFLVIPFVALFVPIVKMIPQFLQWRIRTQIYHRYGELKHLENQMKPESAHRDFQAHLDHLDRIEANVNAMKVPLDFSEHIYVLREHIDFVRARLSRSLEKTNSETGARAR
jgi:hypothetical protein